MLTIQETTNIMLYGDILYFVTLLFVLLVSKNHNKRRLFPYLFLFPFGFILLPSIILGAILYKVGCFIITTLPNKLFPDK